MFSGIVAAVGRIEHVEALADGVRITVEDGTWGLIRASSNKPELVVVVESPVSEANRNQMFAELKHVLATHPSVGAFNQTI